MGAVGKPSRLWIINVVSFFLFCLMAVTGLINWLVLPRGWGYGAGGGLLVSLRHFLMTVHEWTGLVFMIVIVVHISLHWTYVKNNLDRYRKTK